MTFQAQEDVFLFDFLNPVLLLYRHIVRLGLFRTAVTVNILFSLQQKLKHPLTETVCLKIWATAETEGRRQGLRISGFISMPKLASKW